MVRRMWAVCAFLSACLGCSIKATPTWSTTDTHGNAIVLRLINSLDDIKQAEAVTFQAFEQQAWIAARFEQERADFTAKNYAAFVAQKTDGSVVGYISCNPVKGVQGQYHVSLLAVDPKYHKLGISQLLTQAIVALLPSIQTFVWRTRRNDNEALVQLYKQFAVECSEEACFAVPTSFPRSRFIGFKADVKQEAFTQKFKAAVIDQATVEAFYQQARELLDLTSWNQQ